MQDSQEDRGTGPAIPSTLVGRDRDDISLESFEDERDQEIILNRSQTNTTDHSAPKPNNHTQPISLEKKKSLDFSELDKLDNQEEGHENRGQLTEDNSKESLRDVFSGRSLRSIGHQKTETDLCFDNLDGSFHFLFFFFF